VDETGVVRGWCCLGFREGVWRGLGLFSVSSLLDLDFCVLVSQYGRGFIRLLNVVIRFCSIGRYDDDDDSMSGLEIVGRKLAQSNDSIFGSPFLQMLRSHSCCPMLCHLRECLKILLHAL